MTIKEIIHGSKEYIEEIQLRLEILRNPLGLEFSTAELDDEKSQFHIGIYQGTELCGCLVLKPVDKITIQMRQVCIKLALQKNGLGKKLVSYSEVFAKEKGFREMILHARETVVPFYKRMGYSVNSEKFIEVTIPHFSMIKELK